MWNSDDDDDVEEEKLTDSILMAEFIYIQISIADSQNDLADCKWIRSQWCFK